MDKRMKLVNLTEHDVNVYGNMTNHVYVLKACSEPVRMEYDEEYFGKCVKRKNFKGLNRPIPGPVEGTVYVVPNHVRDRFKERKDLASPCTKVFDKATGRIIGCRWLQIN